MMKAETLERIMKYLDGKDWTSPTEIGHALHPTRMYGSPWASPKCKYLVDNGFLERNSKGWYRIKR